MDDFKNSPYPFWMYIFDFLDGDVHQSHDQSLRDLLIRYHNRTNVPPRLSRDAGKFLKLFFSDKLTVLPYWCVEKKRNYKIWRKRMKFIYENNSEIFIRILSRKDFNSEVSKAMFHVDVYTWLDHLPPNLNYEQGEITNWLESIETLYSSSKIVLGQEASLPQKLEASNLFESEEKNKNQIKYFYQLFKGEDDEEKKRKFDKMIELLIEERYISNKNELGLYKWADGRSARGKLLSGLCTVLNENYFSQNIKPEDGERLLGQWIRIDDDLKTINTILLPNRVKGLTDKHTEDFESMLKPLY